jgi:hypothetical protein
MVPGVFSVIEWFRKEMVQVARTITRQRKRRSGWCHPLNINRNTRRCTKRRRSASARARHAVAALVAQETLCELREAREHFSGRRISRGGPTRRPQTRLAPRRAW